MGVVEPCVRPGLAGVEEGLGQGVGEVADRGDQGVGADGEEGQVVQVRMEAAASRAMVSPLAGST